MIAVGLGIEGDDALAERGLDGARERVTVGDKLEGGVVGYHAARRPKREMEKRRHARSLKNGAPECQTRPPPTLVS